MASVGLLEHDHEVVEGLDSRSLEFLDVGRFLEIAPHGFCIIPARIVSADHRIKHVVERIAHVRLVKSNAQRT